MSRDGQLPLCSQVDEGNKVDSKLFPDSLSQIRDRLAALSVDSEDLTVVYDKGNLSKANQAVADEAPFGYVASLTPAHHPELKAPTAGSARYIESGMSNRSIEALMDSFEQLSADAKRAAAARVLPRTTQLSFFRLLRKTR